MEVTSKPVLAYTAAGNKPTYSNLLLQNINLDLFHGGKQSSFGGVSSYSTDYCSDKIGKRSSPYVVTVLRVGSLVGFVPFSIEFNRDDNQYEVASLNLIRMVSSPTL